MPSGFYVWFIFVIAFVVAAALLSAPMDAKTGFFGLDLRKVDLAWLRDIGFFLAGAGIAPLGLWLANRRTRFLQGQTDNETARRITDAFTKAIELLGNENIAVRQGGIFALGRLAFENVKECQKILDILAAYIRLGSKERFEKRLQEEAEKLLRDAQTSGEDIREITAEHPKVINAFKALEKEPMPLDIDAAFAVIRDLNSAKSPHADSDFEPAALDLSNAVVFNADLSRTMLMEANLSDSQFRDCLFVGTNLSSANMADSNFADSDLHDADLSYADMHGAKFNGANLRDTAFAGADLRGAMFDGADLHDTDFMDANVRGANFSGAMNLTLEQMEEANGDGETQMPAGVMRPAKWTKPGQ